MKTQEEMEQLVEIESRDREIQIRQQKQQIIELEQHLQHMKELNDKNEYASQFVQNLIDEGDVVKDEDHQLVLTRGPNVIGNAVQFS